METLHSSIVEQIRLSHWQFEIEIDCLGVKANLREFAVLGLFGSLGRGG